MYFIMHVPMQRLIIPYFTTVRIALKLIPDSLQTQPVFLCVDDTMVSKFGTKFENVSKLFGHAAHNGSNYLNGHCFCTHFGGILK